VTIYYISPFFAIARRVAEKGSKGKRRGEMLDLPLFTQGEEILGGEKGEGGRTLLPTLFFSLLP